MEFYDRFYWYFDKKFQRIVNFCVCSISFYCLYYEKIRVIWLFQNDLKNEFFVVNIEKIDYEYSN